MQLDSFLCVEKRNKNPWYLNSVLFIAYCASIRFVIAFLHNTQAIVGYKFMHGVVPNLVY